jgi:hypothetical protein
MRKALIITLGIILLLALFIPLVTALTDSDADYLIKQYSVFDIKRNCVYNGSSCDYAAACNITINSVQGNGTILYNNTLMTNQGSYHNLTLTGADTKIAGWYQGMITCEDHGDYGSDSFYYRVTPTGDENNTNTFIIIGVVFALIIAFGYLIRDEYVVFIGGIAALIAGIYGEIYGFGSTQTDFTRMLSLVIIGLGIIFTIQPAYSLIESSGETGMEEVIEVES